MKYRLLFCVSAMLLVTSLGAQTAKPEWQAGVDNIKTLLKTDVEQAVDAANDLTKGKNKKNIDLLLAVAEVFVDAKHLDEAEEFVEKAKSRDNKDPRVSILAGDIALAREDVGTACQLYEQAIYFDNKCVEAYLKYANVYKSANPSLAIAKLKELKTVIPDCVAADKALADVYYSAKQFGEAAKTYETFIDTPIATESDMLNYAFALFLNHDFAKSLEIAQKGLSQNSRHAAFNRLAMYNYIDLKRYAEAEQAADAFFNETDDAEYSYLDHRYYGVLLSALKKYDRAIEEYGKALEKDSTQYDLYREISETYEHEDKYEEAIGAYQKYVDSLEPEKKTLENTFQFGRLYYAEGTSRDTIAVTPEMRVSALQKADSVFTVVAEKAPDSHLGNLWRARTNSALDPETTAGLAKPYYEKVVEMLLAKDDQARYKSALVESYSYLGYYYLLQSQYETSVEFWNKILAIDPENATAKKALEGIQLQ